MSQVAGDFRVGSLLWTDFKACARLSARFKSLGGGWPGVYRAAFGAIWKSRLPLTWLSSGFRRHLKVTAAAWALSGDLGAIWKSRLQRRSICIQDGSKLWRRIYQADSSSGKMLCRSFSAGDCPNQPSSLPTFHSPILPLDQGSSLVSGAALSAGRSRM